MSTKSNTTNTDAKKSAWKEGITKKGNKKYSKIIAGKWCNVVECIDKNGYKISVVIYNDDCRPNVQITESNRDTILGVIERSIIKNYT